MPNYCNPRTVSLIHKLAFATPAATTGTTVFCWLAPAACTVTELNLESNADLGAGTIAVAVKNGSATIANHPNTTAFTGKSFTTETLVTTAISDGDTVSIRVIGDGTLDCTITAQMTVVYGYPSGQG